MTISAPTDYTRYFRYLESKAPSTREAYRYTISKFIDFLDGKEPTQELAEDFLETFRNGDKNNTPRSILRHIVALRSFFKWAKIPVELSQPYLQETLPPFITMDEFMLMIERAYRPRLKAAIAILFGACLRLSEACNLEVANVNPEGTIRVMGKGGRERLIPVEPEIIEMVEPWRSTVKNFSKYMFPGQNPSKPQRKNGFQAMIRNHMKRCGIKDKSVHSLRHGGATSLYEGGMDLRGVQELLGHKNLTTTAIYAHMTPERLREEVKKARRFG